LHSGSKCGIILEECDREFLALVEVAVKAPQLREKLGLLELND
jgi:hypothetical protein